MALFSWTTLSIVVIIVYLFVATQKMIELMNPLHGVNVSMFANTIDPHWQENQKFSMVCYLSLNSKPAYDILRDNGKKGVILWQKDDLKYQILQSELTKEIKLLHSDSLSSTTFKPDNESNFEISPKFWKIIRSNQSTVYLHVLVSADDSLKSDSQPHTSVLYGSVKLIKYDRIPKSFRHRYLLSDFGWVNVPESESMKSRMPADTIISYWKPEVAIKLVTDFSKYPYEYLPESLRKHVFQQSSDHLSASTTSTTSSVNQKQLKYYYKPPIHVDEIGLTTDKYIPLNNTVSYLPLKLSYSSMSLERWLLMQQMEHSLSEQKSFGFTDKDIDDVRRLISDTSVYLLGFTIVASLLHLLFEFLAFQSDISFWKENKSLAGLSTRAVVTDLFSQIIVFLYLIDSDTSVLVTIPAFFGIGIQAWKVKKATGLEIKKCVGPSLFGYTIVFTRWQVDDTADTAKPTTATANISDIKSTSTSKDTTITTHSSPNTTNKEMGTTIVTDEILTKVTLDADNLATRYIGTFLLPIAASMIIRSLIIDKHASWYSWGIGALTGFVYTFGFVMMCPQLFINYKLKSVAALPWKFLIYKFLNTFIDDLFAFIIKMPTMHRLSVFRDDIVFFIYIYQRWIYRIDTTRPIEK